MSATTDREFQSALDSRRFRDLMGHFATGVTIITTAVDDQYHGMTANALTSVSLDPMLLLVCVDRDAHCHTQLTGAGHFGVNILAAHQEQISNIFAKKAEPETASLRGVPFHLGAHGAPLLDDCLAQVECRVRACLDGGDHDIFLGEVLGGQVVAQGDPLLFHRGAYRRLGRQ